MILEEKLGGNLDFNFENKSDIEKVIFNYWQFILENCCNTEEDLKNRMLYFLQHSDVVLVGLLSDIKSFEIFYQKYMTSINLYIEKSKIKYEATIEELLGKHNVDNKFKTVIFCFEEITWELYKSLNFGKGVM